MSATSSASGPAPTDLYVSTTGSDSNNGTQGSPFATIAAAAAHAKPGTTIHVAPGSYVGGFTTSASGTSSAPITYVSDVPGGAKIVAGGSSDMAWWNKSDYVTIKGFDISGSTYRIGLYGSGSHDIFQGNVVHDILTDASTYANAQSSSNGGAGIEMDSYAGATGSSILGNTIYNIGPSGQTSSLIGAIYDTESGSIENNVVYDTAGAGLVTWHGAQHISIINNTVDHAADCGIFVGSGDSGSSSTTGDYISVENNIVTSSKNGIYEGGTTGLHNIYVDNLVFNDSAAPIRLQNGLTASGTVKADPKYADPTNHNYRLQAGSPAIGAGTSLNAPSTDIAGDPRPTPGGGYDIGAYQMTQSSGSSAEIFPGKGSFTDAKGNVYTLTANKAAMENGSPIPGGSGTAAMELYNSQVYGQDANSANWYIWNQSYWVSASAPPTPTPAPTPTPTPTTVEIFPGNGSFTDAKGNVYTLAANKAAMENGNPIPGGSGTAAMELYNSQVYGQDANSGNWYIWNQSYWASASAPPAPLPSPTPAAETSAAASITTSSLTIGDNQANANISQSDVTATASSGDRMAFIMGSNDPLVPQGGAGTISNTGSNNAFTMPVAGGGPDVFTTNPPVSGKLDFRTALQNIGWDDAHGAPSTYPRLTSTANGTSASISPDGHAAPGASVAPLQAAQNGAISTLLARALVTTA